MADAFERWLRRLPDGATLVANIGDPGVEAVVDRLARPAGCGSSAYALVDALARTRRLPARASRDRFTDRRRTGERPPRPDRRADAQGTTLEVHGLDRAGRRRSTVRLATAGRHNAANALAVAGAALRPRARRRTEIADGLATFSGVGRRLERKGEAAGVVVYDDYGHHPTAIRETLAAVRQREPGRRVWAVYEPLTYHRTAAMLDAFAEVLAEADAVAIADIWAGRDPGHDDHLARPRWPTPSPRDDPGSPVLAPGSVEATADALARGGPSRRRRARHGRRPQLPDRRAPAGATGGAPMIDYAAAGDLLEAYGAAWAGVRRRCLGRALHARMPSTMRTRSARRSSATMPCGHGLLGSAATQRDVDFTVERHWVSGSTVLAAGTRPGRGRTDGSRVRIAGFLTAEIAPDGRIGRFREWSDARADVDG